MTGDRLVERWEFDHHEAVEFFWPFQDLEAPAPGEDLAAIFRDNGGTWSV
jgi:hypothetical protein